MKSERDKRSLHMLRNAQKPQAADSNDDRENDHDDYRYWLRSVIEAQRIAQHLCRILNCVHAVSDELLQFYTRLRREQGNDPEVAEMCEFMIPLLKAIARRGRQAASASETFVNIHHYVNW